MDAAAMLEAARSMLQANGLPINAANLNRAVMAVSQGTAMPQSMNASEQRAERPMQRSMQSRTRSQGNVPAPPQQPLDDSGNRVRLTDGANPIMDSINAQIEAGGMGGAPLNETLPTETAAIPRRGSMPRAQRIDEENPEEGMYSNAPPRQADETGVDVMGLGTALSAPFMALLSPAAGGLGAAMAGARGPLPAAMQAERAVAAQRGQAAAALRDRAIRGINQDRASRGDPRGMIERARSRNRVSNE